MGDSEMNEIKAKLKELAALCIDKELVFHCDGLSNAFIYTAYTTDSDGKIKYIGKSSEIASDWKSDSIERLNEVIALVENHNG
jgi:hypothetical protein